jgi:hypothetical protein
MSHANDPPTRLERGLEVEVFEDPFTRRRPEGLARLVRCLDAHFAEGPEGVVELWRVRFTFAGIGDGEIAERRILRASVGSGDVMP